MHKYLLITLLFSSNWCLGDPGSKANKLFEKGKRNEAIEQAYKGIEKDSLEPLSYLALARCLIYVPIPRELDSAHWANQKAKSLLSSLANEDSIKVLKKLDENFNWNELDSRIDQKSYEYALSLDQVFSYQHFIDLHPNSIHAPKAEEIRDSLAYEIALAKGNSKALVQFLNDYPNSKQAIEAKGISELFHFKESVRNGDWKSYHRFSESNPNSPFADEAQKEVFQLRTFRNSTIDFQNFRDSSPNNRFSKTCDSILSFEKKILQPEPIKDLKVLIPSVDGTSIRLFSSDSNFTSEFRFDSIPGKFLFDKANENWLVAKGRNGSTLCSNGGPVERWRDLQEIQRKGFEWVQIKNEKGEYFEHLVGRNFQNQAFEKINYAYPEMIFGKFHGSWNAYAPTGHQYNEAPFDSIFSIDNLICGKRNELWMGFNYKEVLESGRFPDPTTYGDLKWNQGFLSSNSENKFWIIDTQTGKPMLSTEGESLESTKYGWLIKNNLETKLVDFRGQQINELNLVDFKVLNFGYAWKASKNWIVISSDTLLGVFDSIASYGQILNRLWLNDTLFLQSTSSLIQLEDSGDHALIMNPVDPERFYFSQPKQKENKVFDWKGNLMFSSKGEEFKYLGENAFRSKSQKGYSIIDSLGENITDKEYEFISTPDKGQVILYEKGKYSIYFLRPVQFTDNEFEERPKPISQKDFFIQSEDKLFWSMNFDSLKISLDGSKLERILGPDYLQIRSNDESASETSDSSCIFSLRDKKSVFCSPGNFFSLAPGFIEIEREGSLGVYSIEQDSLIIPLENDGIWHYRMNDTSFFLTFFEDAVEDFGHFRFYNEDGKILNSARSRLGNWLEDIF